MSINFQLPGCPTDECPPSAASSDFWEIPENGQVQTMPIVALSDQLHAFAYISNVARQMAETRQRVIVAVSGYSGIGKSYTLDNLLPIMRKDFAGDDPWIQQAENAERLDDSHTDFADADQVLGEIRASHNNHQEASYVTQFDLDLGMRRADPAIRAQLRSSTEEWVENIGRRSIPDQRFLNASAANGKGMVYHLDDIYSGGDLRPGGHHVIPPGKDIVVAAGHDPKDILSEYCLEAGRIDVLLYMRPGELIKNLLRRDIMQGKLSASDPDPDRVAFRAEEFASQTGHYGLSVEGMRERFPNACIIDKTGLTTGYELPDAVRRELDRTVRANRERLGFMLED